MGRFKRRRTGAAWERTKREVRDRAEGQCEGCKAAPGSHVHHLRYWPMEPDARGRKVKRVGGEPLEWLQYLCKRCHTDEHRNGGPARKVPLEEYRAAQEQHKPIKARQTGPLFTRGRSPPPTFRTNYYD